MEFHICRDGELVLVSYTEPDPLNVVGTRERDIERGPSDGMLAIKHSGGAHGRSPTEPSSTEPGLVSYTE